MRIKGIVDEDFINYKVPSMFINTCKCSFKCDIESGFQCCQNATLSNMPTYNIKDEIIIKRFLNNSISKAIVIGGLEPIDTLIDLISFIEELNCYCVDCDLVIYTGYYEDEIYTVVQYIVEQCKRYRNLIIKYGRYIPNKDSIYDSILGVYLASNNQYAKCYPKETPTTK